MFRVFLAFHYWVDNLLWSVNSCSGSYKSTESTPSLVPRNGLCLPNYKSYSDSSPKKILNINLSSAKASLCDKDLCTHSLDRWLIIDQSFSNDVCSHLHSGAVCYMNCIYPDSYVRVSVCFIPTVAI